MQYRHTLPRLEKKVYKLQCKIQHNRKEQLAKHQKIKYVTDRHKFDPFSASN